MRNLLNYLVLPKAITGFERDHLGRMNRIAMLFFLLHLPVLVAVAALNQTGALRAAVLTSLVLVGPAIAWKTFENPRAVSMVFAVTAMCMGGLLVHFGQGPMQIEMHFYFFVLIALLSVFANPMVNVAAALTVTVHHLLVWILIPRSVFNYDASIWTVVVHALFVVLETVAACFVARSFFDNVIGLERIVKARTADVEQRNTDMRLILGAVGQGFMSINVAGELSAERSSIVDRWFGPVTAGTRFSDYLAAVDPVAAEWFELGWLAVQDDFLSLDHALDQLPKRMVHGNQTFQFEYRPVMADGAMSNLLIVVTDITDQIERDRALEEGREMVQILDRVVRDRSGVVQLVTEGDMLMKSIGSATDTVLLLRLVHTLKGNCAFFGIASISRLCHAIESRLSDEHGLMTTAEHGGLSRAWTEFRARLSSLLNERVATHIEIDHDEHQAFIAMLCNGTSRSTLARVAGEWRNEAAERRLNRIADQARALARRLDKGDVSVRVEANRVRVPSDAWGTFWSTLVHAVRNAVDHGIEPAAVRVAASKPPAGTITLRTRALGDTIQVELRDDGRGIDWEAIAVKAAEKGLAHATPDDLREALFSSGLSTRADATEISGRGIGMGALRDAARILGGTLTVDSEAGRGTTIRFSIPAPELPRVVQSSSLRPSCAPASA